MDLGTGLALFGAAQIVGKVLGPTAEYIGEGLRDWTERGVHNVQRIFENAIRMLGNEINTDGAVPPRVLRAVLDEGAFIEDELAKVLSVSNLSQRNESTGRFVLFDVLGWLDTKLLKESEPYQEWEASHGVAQPIDAESLSRSSLTC